NRAIQLNPEYALAYYNLGTALSDQGKLDEAIAAYRTALRLPDEQGTRGSAHTLAHNALGYALQQQGNLQEAISQYQTAIQLDPEFPQAITNLREAQRLLALRDNPLPDDREERLPSRDENPIFSLQRSIVLIITATPTGLQYGTGWVIHQEGDITLIVTNRHVVSDENTERPSDSIEIELYSQNDPEHRLRFPAQIRDITDPGDPLDLAVLEVRNLPDDIEPLPLANSPVSMDADIRIIGHPLTGTPWTLQRGYIANITAEPDQQNLQIGGTNLAVGNSGSPVIYNNEVVGLVVRISNEQAAASPERQGDTIGGFGFAYPLDVLAQHLQDWGIRF
ncbi:MAG: tetratricopeptide repeat protein, partial [Phormidium sp. SL48-SHIP]